MLSGSFSHYRTPKPGDGGIDPRFLHGLVEEVKRACNFIFSNNFSVKPMGNSGTFVDLAASASMEFSGTAYIAGRKTTGLGTKKWVRCNLAMATAVDHDGPPPDPFPMNEEWYEVSKTSGDIHIPRA